MMGTSSPCLTTCADPYLLAREGPWSSCWHRGVSRAWWLGLPDLSNHLAWPRPGRESRPAEVHGKSRAWVEKSVLSRYNSLSPISGLYPGPLYNLQPPPGHLGRCLCKKAPQPPAMPPIPNTQFLLTASRQSQGPGPSSWSLFPRPHPSLGTTFPVSTLCTFFSELLRGFSLKTMKRNLQTGGSILSWVCMEGKKRQRGG